jgi:glycerate 2-kinase
VRVSPNRLRQHLASIVSAGLTAVDAKRATARALTSLADSLRGESSIRVVAAGKAAVGMASVVDEMLGGRVASGLITANVSGTHPRWRTIAATHPEPSAASEAAGREALRLADRCAGEGGLLLVCLSGGASAMLAVPADGLSIEDKARTTAALLAAGLDIGAINTVRRHLSAIKGGQLAARAGRVLTLAISDVCTPVEDDPAVIGSGPTVGDPTTFADAVRVVRDAGLEGQIPTPSWRHLTRGLAGEVPGPVSPTRSVFEHCAYFVIASRRDAMRASADVAARLGYHVSVVPEPTIGEARGAAAAFIDRARSLPRPACLIATGRNQEFALAAMPALAALGPAALASLGSDGVDGPTDAAGAIVTSDMALALGPAADVDVQAALANNDSYPVLDRLEALVRSGPSGTNVGDVQILLLDS